MKYLLIALVLMSSNVMAEETAQTKYEFCNQATKDFPTYTKVRDLGVTLYQLLSMAETTWKEKSEELGFTTEQERLGFTGIEANIKITYQKPYKTAEELRDLLFPACLSIAD